MLDGREHMAYIDSGASHSSLPQSWLPAMSDEVRATFRAPPKSNPNMSLAALNVSVPRLGSIEHEFHWNRTRFTHRFEIVDPPQGITITIGRDLFTTLGIVLGGLPLPQSARPSTEATPIDAKPSIADPDDIAPHPMAAHPGLLAAIERNQAVPRDSFCSLEEATVRLDTGDASPRHRRQYPVAHALRGIIDEQIAAWLADGKVRVLTEGSVYNLPLLVVPKRNHLTGAKEPGRVCLDPRALNQDLQLVRYPLPLISEMFEFLAGREVYSSLDLEQSFLQLPIYGPHQHKVAFTWQGVQYCFVGTPFGLTPTPAVLQRTVVSIFRASTCAKPYQDDIAIGSYSLSDHLTDLIRSIDALTTVSLRIRADKCQFFRPALHLLGHTFNAHGISIDRRKLADVLHWPRPDTGNQIEKYLGLINYFRDFIPMYATLAAPLESMRKIHRLTAEHCTSDRIASFTGLKDVLAQGTFLSFPDFEKPFTVATDASGTGTAATLYQLKDVAKVDTADNRLWVQFAARALHQSERNYSTTKRELLAIVFALKKLHCFVLGRRFTFYTDHRAPSMLKVITLDPSQDAMSYVVDKLLDHRGPASKREYLVRWKSFDKSHDSWEPVHNFNDLSCIRRYWSSKGTSHSGEGNVVPRTHRQDGGLEPSSKQHRMCHRRDS